MHQAMSDPAFYKQPGEEIARQTATLKQLEQQIATAYARWEELEAQTAREARSSLSGISHVCHGLESEPSTNGQDPPRFQAVFGGEQATAERTRLDVVLAGFPWLTSPTSNRGTQVVMSTHGSFCGDSAVRMLPHIDQAVSFGTPLLTCRVTVSPCFTLV